MKYRIVLYLLLINIFAKGETKNNEQSITPHDLVTENQINYLDESLERMLFEEQEVPPLCYALAELTCPTEHITFAQTKDHTKTNKAKTLFMVYIAADNDLKIFAARNIRQMALAGSNSNVTIVVHLDIRLNNNYKVTRRYLIEQNKITHLNAYDAVTQRMDSGDPKTLISFCEFAINTFAADKHVLIFWNHGTGILDPERGRIIDPSALFVLNQETHKLDLDRRIGYLEALERAYNDLRGVCWDDSTNNYLSNQKLIAALSEICNRILKGKKFDIIGFDACLMSMIEVANIIKNYANIMVSSQEVELGTGWLYNGFLTSLSQRDMTPHELASSIVSAYDATYKSVTEDYTLSAIDLQHMNVLEQLVNTVAKLLKECIKQQNYNSVINSIKASRNRLLCTHFDEPSYVDLHHLCGNLLTNLPHFSLQQSPENSKLLTNLKQALIDTRVKIEESVFSYCTGNKLNKARGISIYFPEQFIFKSYPLSPFAQSYEWLSFLKTYLTL